jgi:hypothetical protein
MIRRFFSGKPLARPEDIIPFLARGEFQWRKSRSAYEAAHSWFGAHDLPQSVREVIEGDSVFAGAKLIEAFFEKETDLDTFGRPSQTDVLALLRLKSGLGVLGIEAKVDETFGPLISEWRDGSPGKEQRLSGLAIRVGFDPGIVEKLRYQLLHRTAATLIEAERYGACDAAMIIQSFDPNHAWFDEFRLFSEAMSLALDKPGKLSPALEIGGIRLRLGWVADRPTSC